ncbi:hypothetical protein ACN20G_37005 (plasmid) [Streptomyces sp. BI20]|uniref:hypothetical protein n=1 Tax=Streptomyces sp. BI20 TaxID=3403460 RepID=UPI003C71EEC4
MSISYPLRLRALQLQLHRVSAEQARYAATLPWSAEPLPGWPASEHRHSHRGAVPPSPGYTPDQAAEIARLRRRTLRLAEAISAHPHWATVEREQLVAARMGLKRVTTCTDDAAGDAAA